MISTLIFFLPLLLVYTIFVVYAERKVSGFIQDRLGPMETGRYGLAQTVADLLKLLQKEDITNNKADKWLFRLGPPLIFLFVFLGYSVLPLSPTWHGASFSGALLLLFAIISLDVIAILMAGWSSNSKFSLLGTFRSASQMVSYEIPMALAVLCVVIVTQSMDLNVISLQQSSLIKNCVGCNEDSYLLGFAVDGNVKNEIGGFLNWHIFQMPYLVVIFIIFFVCALAESNRVPFDLPESESELIGGFHTEYSGFRWAIIMLSEYAMMLLLSLLAVVLFLGSWSTPLPNFPGLPLAEWTTGEEGTFLSGFWAIFWLTSKAILLIFLQIVIRFTYPRLRADQLMSLSWKYLTPAALISVFICAAWKIWV